MLFAHGVQCLVGKQAAIQAAPGSITSKRRVRPGSPVIKVSFWHPDLTTMHVWIWYPNPAGLYSSTNPLVALFNGG